MAAGQAWKEAKRESETVTKIIKQEREREREREGEKERERERENLIGNQIDD
jgi:hypothetical protein